jgi:hypothetical protein
MKIMKFIFEEECYSIYAEKEKRISICHKIKIDQINIYRKSVVGWKERKIKTM